MLDGYIKAMCLKLAELALETKGVDVSISNFYTTISHYTYENEKTNIIYFDNIHFAEENAEERIEKALEYVRGVASAKN